MEDIIESLKFNGHRDSTRKNYYSIWKQFNNFFIKLDSKPTEWEDRLSLFAAFLVQNGKQSSTVRSYMSALKAVLFNAGLEITENRCLLSAITRGCKLKNDVVKIRLPIQKGMLRIILRMLITIFLRGDNNQPYLPTLYRALFSTAYYGLFRVGEVTTGSHPIMAKDVHVETNKRKMLFILRSSKTHDKSNHLQSVKICGGRKDSKQDDDPFNLLREYIKI